jgi:hypothetical protein
VNGWEILKDTLNKRCEGVDWVQVVDNRDEMRASAETVLYLQIKEVGNLMAFQRLPVSEGLCSVELVMQFVG